MAQPLADDEGRRRYDRQLLKAGADLGFRLREPAQAECYFCNGVDVHDTKEHIIARWLQEELGMHGETFTPTYYNRGVPQHERGEIPAANLVATGICQGCNTGWMSQVEADFQPFFQGRRRDANLAAIVRWWTKTAFVLNVTQNTRLLVPRALRLQLAKGHISDRVAVYMHRLKKDSSNGRLNWIQGACTPPHPLPGEPESFFATRKRLWACAIRIDDIIGTVVVNSPGDLYRSSWEIEGAIAVEDGDYADHMYWAALPQLRDFTHAVFLIPQRLACATSREMESLNEWFEGPGSFPHEIKPDGIGELQAVIAVMVEQVYGDVPIAQAPQVRDDGNPPLE